MQRMGTTAMFKLLGKKRTCKDASIGKEIVPNLTIDLKEEEYKSKGIADASSATLPCSKYTPTDHQEKTKKLNLYHPLKKTTPTMITHPLEKPTTTTVDTPNKKMK